MMATHSLHRMTAEEAAAAYYPRLITGNGGGLNSIGWNTVQAWAPALQSAIPTITWWGARRVEIQDNTYCREHGIRPGSYDLYEIVDCILEALVLPGREYQLV